MNAIHVKCPSCGAKLAVPSDVVKANVRCGRCKHKFPISTTQPKKIVEDVVASWLDGDAPPEAEEPNIEDVAEDVARSAEPGAPALGPMPTGKGAIRAVKIERRGVLFEFAASRLLEPGFRTAFPRQCLSCDSRAHLRAHVVIYASQLTDSLSMEDEHSAGALVLSDAEVRGLSDEELLNRLPHVPNVPHPADLPMPYWICDMCSGAGHVRGQIQVNAKTGKGFCQLFIRNIRRGFQFMTEAGGEEAEGYEELKERVEKTTDDPWDNLPEVIQHRIQQWFNPEKDEVFVAYVPDRDHARTEDGIAGVVISSKRLIYHTPRSHRELNIKESLELSHASGGGKGRVSITTSGWRVRQMSVDRDGLRRMRRALATNKFQAVWH